MLTIIPLIGNLGIDYIKFAGKCSLKIFDDPMEISCMVVRKFSMSRAVVSHVT
jgi:hypothetical protein